MADDGRRIEIKRTIYPGARVIVKLDISAHGLRALLDGENVNRVWLTDSGDGIYLLHSDGPVGEPRRHDVKPAVDVLVDLLNDFAETLGEHEAACPPELTAAFDGLLEAWNAYGSDASALCPTYPPEETR